MTPVPTGPGFDFNEFLRRLADHGVVAETPPPFVDELDLDPRQFGADLDWLEPPDDGPDAGGFDLPDLDP